MQFLFILSLFADFIQKVYLRSVYPNSDVAISKISDFFKEIYLLHKSFFMKKGC